MVLEVEAKKISGPESDQKLSKWIKVDGEGSQRVGANDRKEKGRKRLLKKDAGSCVLGIA